MPSQVSANGAAASVNQLSGQAVPVAAAVGSPPTWFPGLYWYDTTNTVFKQWNTSSWVSSPAPGTRYLALLTQDPVANGVINLSDNGFVECATSGYSRQTVTFGQVAASPTQVYPSQTSNTNLITWTMAATMTTPVQWVALVTVSSTTVGFFLASWAAPAPITVNASQSIQIGIGSLVI